MADINTFAFTGRLTADAALKTLPSGKTLMEASVAVNTGYGDYKKTLFLKVNQWGDRAVNVVPYLKRGSLVGGTGELSTNEWSGRDGQLHSQLTCTVMSLQILASKRDDNGSAQQSDSSAGSSEEYATEEDSVF